MAKRAQILLAGDFSLERTSGCDRSVKALYKGVLYEPDLEFLQEK